jgi:hypothetical protein
MSKDGGPQYNPLVKIPSTPIKKREEKWVDKKTHQQQNWSGNA